MNILRRLIVLCLVLPACKPSTTSEPTPISSPPASGFIAVVGTSVTEPFWPLYQASVQRYQQSFTTLPIRCEAPPEPSPQAQAEIVARLVKEGLRGLCIEPADDEIFARTLEPLADSGLVVVTLRRRPPSPRLKLHSGMDPEALGISLAEAVVETVGRNATIAVTHADASDADSQEKHRAFSRRLSEISAVSVVLEPDCAGDPLLARRQIQEGLLRYPRTAAWVSLGSWPFAQIDPNERVLPETCRGLTVDPDPAQWPRLRSGELFASLGTDYDALLVQALRLCNRLCRGEIQSAQTIVAPIERVTRDNVDAWTDRWKCWIETAPLSTSPPSHPGR